MRYEYGLAFFCGVVVMALANALSLGLLPCRALAVIFLLVALAAVAVSGYLFGRRSCGSWCSAAHTMRAFARDWRSDGLNGSRRYRGSWRMNEEELLIGFLKLYLDGLDKVSKYDAVRVGIEILLSEKVFRDSEELSLVLSVESRIKISAERLQGMAAGRVIYMHPAIPAK